MNVETPKLGDVVAYYPPRTDDSIRTPIAATVRDVWSLTDVSVARAPAREHCNAVDLDYFVDDVRHFAQRVPYTADQTDRRPDEYWVWPA